MAQKLSIPFTWAIPLDTMPKDVTPPTTLGRFILHYWRQIKGVLLAMFLLEALVAALLAMIPVMLGWLADAVNSGTPPAQVMAQPWLWQVGVTVLVLWAGGQTALWYLYDHIWNPRFGNMIRRQLVHYTLGQGMAYFNNDYAGRIANKVLESGPSLREPTRSVIGSVWYAGFFVVVSIGFMASSHWLLAVPAFIWLGVYIALLVAYVPTIKRLSTTHSEVHSKLVGRVVDALTNMLTVKLFAKEKWEDTLTHQVLTEHATSMARANHMVWRMRAGITVANVLLLASTTAVALWLWGRGEITPGTILMALPMVWQMTNMSGWIQQEVTRVFEELGRVEECINTIAKPYTVVDAPGAKRLKVSKGEVTFSNVSFHYGKQVEDGDQGIITNLNLTIKPGERVGLVGKSGAGKSTLVSLLLRFYDVESGTITIDGQDISRVTQQSLRSSIGMVTQQPDLLHRSIRDNIAYGLPNVRQEDVMAAARRAHAHTFIPGLEDKHGRSGYDALVGERGVKLSGGQRQRIAIARVIMENAPILLLDEATSALDSEVEAAIQAEMGTVMKGKTVIAIAHRLSTIAQMDRLIVMEKGRVIEDGTHAELLKKKGVYAGLWARQSGGFLAEE